MEHWFSLGRPYGAVGRLRVLLSWTGTMFEYLMPFLFQRSYTDSLLDKAARGGCGGTKLPTDVCMVCRGGFPNPLCRS